MFERLTISFVLVAVGCAPAPPPLPKVCSGPRPDQSTRYAILGRESAVRFWFLQDCDPPTSIEASVLDAQNVQVDSTAALDGYEGTVKFTPTATGPYHVTARFQPNRGLGQLDVVAAEDHSADPGLPSPDCKVPQLTSAGLLFCPDGVGDERLFRLTDGGFTLVVQTDLFEAQAVDDVVWAASPLQRLVVTDSGYSPQPRRETVGPDLRPRWPTRDDAIVPTETNWALATVAEDGGLSIRSLNLPPNQGIFWRAGDVMLTVGGGECLRYLDGGSTWGRLPISVGFIAVGGDRSGYWGTSMDRTTLFRHGPGLGQVATLVTGSMPGIGGIFVTTTYGGVPQITAAGKDFIPAANRADIVLEYWGELYGATSTAVVTKTDAGLRLHPR